MPMIECSSCGQCLGHLYDDFYDLSKKLLDELQTSSDVPTGFYITRDGDDIGPFLTTYYEWYSKHRNDKDVIVYRPETIIARALLRIQELSEDFLPFGSHREEDNQLSPFEARACCLRMFQTDPGATVI